MHRHTQNHNHSQGSLPRGRHVVPEDGARASDCFEQFLTAPTLKTILGSYRNICEYLHLKPNILPLFYPKLKAHINSWKAKPLWKKFDMRANQKCYGRGKTCPQTRVLIIGAGPCGLRTAIEAQLLGAKVVVVEKRDRMSRNNVLHLWPFVIDDLRALGAKKFFGKFCAGSIDHISIRQLQCILLKVALLLGVEIHTEVSFEKILEPNLNEKTGWHAEFKPADHPVSQFEFDVIIGADGKRNTLQGFKRKEFRGKLAIAITANFINKRTEAEARVEEISGVAFIFNQKFFKDLYAETGIDLENIVYYKDDTHYFVMTAKKQSLIDKRVIREDLSDTAKLLGPDNVDRDELMNYAREAAEFSTNYQMPDLEFAVNHYGHPDVAMFDFTSMYAAENASRVIERHGYKLLSILVGDSLLEPFWPTGSGCARGFLSSMDAAWAIRSWGSETVTPLEVMAERESIYRLLAQTTPENLNKDYKSYTIDPSTRYPNLNKNALLPHQVTSLYDTDDSKSIELIPRPVPAIIDVPKKRRRRESHVDPDTLLSWIKDQVREHKDLEVTNLTTSFRDGRVLCAIISHYRPDLLDYSAINAQDISKNNQVAFDLLEKELGVSPVMTGEGMASTESLDFSTMLSYLTKIYDTFRCEIPHIKYPKWDMPEIKRNESVFKVRTAGEYIKADVLTSTQPARPSSRHKRHVDTSFLSKSSVALSQDRKARKRKTLEKVGASVEDRQKRLEDIVSNRIDRQNKRRHQRKMQTEQFYKSMQMLQSNCKPDHSEPFEDYSIYLYRQTAPNFEDRVKDLEKKFIYVPDKESRVIPAQAKRETDEDFAARIKDLEDKWREPVSVEKKPKDLLRAIGKIETSDWNIKEIEKKIIENKLGKTVNKDKEKVPKWSREQFLARQTKMERQHLDRQNSTEVKFAEIDKNIKQLEQKLKEGNVRDLNQRKVASITEKLVGKPSEMSTAPQLKPVQKSNSRTVIPINQASEFCHFCCKRVYLVERLTAEGKVFHTGCFRCQYCHTSLRLGSYMFDREGRYGHRFYCTQHYGMPGEIQINKTEKRTVEPHETVRKKVPSNVIGVDLLDRVQTPERIEFSNLSTGHISSDHDESPSPIDEDEWTDRNNINSVIDSESSDDSSSSSETDTDDEAYEEALEEPITKEGTLRWAERYKKRYSHRDNDDSNSDGYSSSDHFSYYENSSGDDDSDTATEGEEEIRARELRKQEVRVEPPIDAGTDTEVKPLSNLSFDSISPTLPSNQILCTVDMPDILNNTLKISKSSDNISSNNDFNSAESELDDVLDRNESHNEQKVQKANTPEVKHSNPLSKSITTSSITNATTKRNFVIPSKVRRKSFGKEFMPIVEPEPLLVIKRTPSKINLPVEIGKPKVQITTNLVNAKKYFGEPSKPLARPPIDKSKRSPLIKQASLPEKSNAREFNKATSTKKIENILEKPSERKTSLFNFEPEESDLKEIDSYIEDLMKGEHKLSKPVATNSNDDTENLSSSIEDLLKALETETIDNTDNIEMLTIKPDEKFEDLLNWIEELDHKAVETNITSSLKSEKYKNLEHILKKPKQADNVVHKLCRDNISLFENHLLGRNICQKVPDIDCISTNNFELTKSKTDVHCNKPRSSVDLDAVKKVDIRKVLQKFENNECQEKGFRKESRREIIVPKNIVKRNSFANFSFNRSFEKDDKPSTYNNHRNSIGSKDFKLRTEMFENKVKRNDNPEGNISKIKHVLYNTTPINSNQQKKSTFMGTSAILPSVNQPPIATESAQTDINEITVAYDKDFYGTVEKNVEFSINNVCEPNINELLNKEKPTILSHDNQSDNFNLHTAGNSYDEIGHAQNVASETENVDKERVNVDTACSQNEIPSQLEENYFQALVTVKNIIRNINVQQEYNADNLQYGQETNELNRDSIKIQDINTNEDINSKPVVDMPMEICSGNEEFHDNEKTAEIFTNDSIFEVSVREENKVSNTDTVDLNLVEFAEHKNNVSNKDELLTPNIADFNLKQNLDCETSINHTTTEKGIDENESQNNASTRCETSISNTIRGTKIGEGESLTELDMQDFNPNSIVQHISNYNNPENFKTRVENSTTGIANQQTKTSDIAEVLAPPVAPMRIKREQHNLSMIPRPTKYTSTENKSDYLLGSNAPESKKPLPSIRAASASPVTARKMDTSFIPIPPSRKKPSGSRMSPRREVGDNTNNGSNVADSQRVFSTTSYLPNLSKLSARSTSADNIALHKNKNDTLKDKIFSRSKEKECSIQ